MPFGVCVGNAFMRSATLDKFRGLLNGNYPRYIFEVLPFNPPFLKQQRVGMHKCIPYENTPTSNNLQSKPEKGISCIIYLISH